MQIRKCVHFDAHEAISCAPGELAKKYVAPFLVRHGYDAEVIDEKINGTPIMTLDRELTPKDVQRLLTIYAVTLGN